MKRVLNKIQLSFNSAAIVLSLLAGLGLSALAFWHFSEEDRRDLQERMLRGTQSLAAATVLMGASPSFEGVLSALVNIRDEVLAGTSVDSDLLQAHSLPPDPLTGESINLRYLPKVRLDSTSGRFLMQEVDGSEREFPATILDSHPEGLKPVSDRGEYYPILLDVITAEDNGVDAVGLNHFHDDQFHLVMDQARDSGFVTSRTAFPLSDEPFLITHAYLALYSPGALPQTITERRQRHIGFIASISFVPSAAIIDFLPESYQGVDAAFITGSEAFSSDTIDPALYKFLEDPEFGRQEVTANGISLHIITRPSWTLSTTYSTPNRWWALSIGLLLTTWMCSLLFYARNRSRRLEELVHQRTLDLAENASRLAESEARYRMLAENVSDVIHTSDLLGICTYISPSVLQQTGYSPDECIGMPITLHMDAESAAHLQGLLRDNPGLFDSHLHSVVERSVEANIHTREGGMLATETTFTLLRDADGHPGGFLGVSRDTTERKRNEVEKSHLEAAFHQSQKMEAIGTLAGGIAHDFNNLLTGILGHAELLKSVNSTKDERLHSIDIIENTALRARDLISQLLGFARKGHYQSLPVDMRKAVEDTISLLSRAIEKNITINFECEDTPLVITGDPSQISHVLLNLAVNARDAMPLGGTLSFCLGKASLTGDEYQDLLEHEHLPAGDYCRIDVSDTGMGIRPENIERIFEPFYTDKPHGTGLGLAMVYGVTRNHGGLVTVSSHLNQGTTFTLFLPLTEHARPGADKPAAPLPVAGRGTILVVDDEELIRNLLATMLQKLGYATALASDGLEGIEQYWHSGTDFDLAIVDMHMPNMGGLDCVRELTRLDPGVKVILTTGYSQEVLDDELDGNNIVGFLQKPFKLQELAEMLDLCLRTG